MQVDGLGDFTNKLQDVTENEIEKAESAESDFDLILKGALNPDAANNVSEEELFAALISERLLAVKGSDLSDQYKSLLETKKNDLRKADGYIPYEDAAKEALKELRANGSLNAEEADKIYSEAFAGAQLDSNKEALYDGRGGAGDETIAVSQLEQALLSARAIVEGFGAEEVKIRSLDEASNSKTPPISEHAVVAPATPEPESQEPELSNENSGENTGHASIPELELALNFSKRILHKDLDRTLMESLERDREL